MKILDYSLYFGAVSVEKIEEEYQMNIFDIILEKTKAKDIMFILWACIEQDVKLEEFKKQLFKIPYQELIEIRNKLINGEEEKKDISVTEA